VARQPIKQAKKAAKVVNPTQVQRTKKTTPVTDTGDKKKKSLGSGI